MIFGGLGVVSFQGCTRGGSEAGNASGQPAQAASGASGTANAPTQPTQVDPNHKETQWIGTIPYDVFYDDPLSIAADSTKLGGSPASIASTTTPDTATPPPASSTETPPSEMPAPASSAKSTAAAPDWKTVIPMTDLVDEIKNLRTRLTANLQTVATFNKSVPSIANDGAMMTAMAAIATQHPEEVNWKDKAKFIRDLGYEVYSKAEGTGRTPFNACKEPYDKMTGMLDGGPPPEMESQDSVPFADVVYTSELMKRIETSVNSLKSNINTEARMKEDPPAVKRELHVLAAIAAMMSTDSYEYTEEQAYQDFVKGFEQSALKGVEAVNTENFSAFQDAINQIQNSCNPCHQKYRGSDTGF